MATPHISAQPGDFAPAVLMPGDPRRAERIAGQLMPDARKVSDVRGIVGYTGTHEGRPLSVMASGMGQPSLSIYATELFDRFGVERIIRNLVVNALEHGEGKPLEPVYEIGKKYALLRPATPGYKVISSTFDKAARDIVSGSDVKATLDQAVKDINADIKSNDGYKAK